ncbi:MAG: formyltetrahydrofolate deformylase [Planctomycetaceae bacterium]|nr:formyltetrahydrofolate deformylase [Planctomycetaceae bacterium]
MPHEIILVHCPDEVGLIHRITGVLASQQLNIESNQEFVDVTTSHFFFRAEVSLSTSFSTQSPAQLKNAFAHVLPEQASIRIVSCEPRPVVICATQEPHCLGELLLLNAVGELPGRIVAVISNYNSLRKLVERFDVPFHLVSHEQITREEHEQRVAELIDTYMPETIVLARYMRVLTNNFVDRYSGQLINIHHSFLPAFVGAAPYRQAFERGVKVIGATAHYVTAELDAGPIIAQDVIPVDHSFTSRQMAQAGRDVEKIVLAKAVRLVLEDRIFVHSGRTVVFS